MLGPSAQCRSDSSATVEAGGRVGGGGRYLWYAPKKEAGMNGVVVLDGRRLPYFTLKHLPVSYLILVGGHCDSQEIPYRRIITEGSSSHVPSHGGGIMDSCESALQGCCKAVSCHI